MVSLDIIHQEFNKMIAAAEVAGDLQAIARMEIAREFFTNDSFKRWLQDRVWQINQSRKG